MTGSELVRLDGNGQGMHPASFRFGGHVETLTALAPGEVQPLLRAVEAAAHGGLHAVGFLAYEAAAAINPVLPSLPPIPGLPLTWFALFRDRFPAPAFADMPAVAHPRLHPAMEQQAYERKVAAIRQLIAAGDCYQLNFTFPLVGTEPPAPLQLYRQMLAAQRPSYGALLDTGRFAILSASPELFFARRGREIVARPMKGTARRGRFPKEDRELIESLRRSAKEQAENLMIVDLLRNDLGMVAKTGSVEVRDLFAIETYPTVHQMTSEVRATLCDAVSLTEILAALFPCGSVTGAPKRRTMEHIASLEGVPRGVYCGAIGHLGPGGEATFSVAIRTLLLDRENGTAIMGVGSGITWDADPVSEYAECLIKGEFISRSLHLGLIESLRLENGRYHRLERHMTRLSWSAGRLGHPFDPDSALALLRAHAGEVAGTRKVRLLLSPIGELAIESQALTDNDSAPLRIAVAGERVDPIDPLLYLKTDQRDRFERARREHPDADEVIFCNRQGELTEGTYHSLVLRLAGRLVTPPLAAGLLPGVMREELLASGEVIEQLLTHEHLLAAEEIWLVNSVRGWRRGIVDADCQVCGHAEVSKRLFHIRPTLVR